jgi:hypothetical protein
MPASGIFQGMNQFHWIISIFQKIEIDVLSKLDHPFIIKYVEHFQDKEDNQNCF